MKAELAAGDCTRTFPARELCEREGWRNAKGEPCLASARAALPKLSSAIGLPLPEARPKGGVSAESLAPSTDFPDSRLSCPLDALDEVGVVPVTDTGKGLECSMMATHHPGGDAACPGGRIRYCVRSSVYAIALRTSTAQTCRQITSSETARQAPLYFRDRADSCAGVVAAWESPSNCP